MSNVTRRLRGRKWRRIRAQVLDAEPMCRACRRLGVHVAAVEVDHIVPIHRGGGDNIGNLQPLCSPHHYVKSQQERRRRQRKGTVCKHGLRIDRYAGNLRCNECPGEP